MRRMEIATALVMLALAAFVVWATSGLAYWTRNVPGPSFMPFWVSIAGAGLAVILLLAAVFRRTDSPPEFPRGLDLLRVVATYGMLWGVLMATPVIGFLTAAVAFMLLTLLGVFRRPLMPSLGVTVVIGLMVHFLFNVWLNVRLPTGPLGI